MNTPRLDPGAQGLAHRALTLALAKFPHLTGQLVEEPEAWRTFAKYHDKPGEFVREVIGANPWAYTDEFMVSVRDNAYTSVRAARGVAKTFTYAMTDLWWMSTREAVVLLFGAREDNIKGQVMAEIGKWHAAAKVPLPGQPDLLHWRLGPRHYTQGIATKTDLGAIGFHSGRVPPEDPNVDLTEEELERLYEQAREAGKLGVWLLVLIDEAIAVPDKVIQALKGSIQGHQARLAMIANPLIDPDAPHEFAKSHKDGSGYQRFHVSSMPVQADETPADRRLVAPNWLVDRKYVDSVKRQWGEDSPRWYSDVLGCFPTSSVDRQMIPRALLRQALATEIEDPGENDCRHIGVDLAASEYDTGDFCVAYLSIAGELSARHQWKAADTMQTVGVVLELMLSWSAVPGEMVPGRNVHIDRNGLGRGVVDRLREKGYGVDAVDPGGGPKGDWPGLLGEQQFLNRRAELMWIMRRALQEGLFKVPERYSEVWQQAGWHTWAEKPRGGGTVIYCDVDKAELKRLHDRSPDDFDAACYCLSRTSMLQTVKALTKNDLKRLGRPPSRILGWKRPGS